MDTPTVAAMHYPHSHQRSAEILRAALPLMSKQPAALTPTAYAVWYAYVAEPGGALRRDVDREIARRGSLDDRFTAVLHDRHFGRQPSAATAADGVPTGAGAGAAADGDVAAGTDGKAAIAASAAEPAAIDVKRLGEFVVEFDRLIGGLGSHAAAASGQTGDYGRTLQRLSASLAPDDGRAPADAAEVLRELIAQTSAMARQMATLETRLVSSQSEIARLRSEVEQAKSESMVDALTDLANRRAFDRRIRQCVDETARGNAPFGLVMLDLDHFKRINDTYGHPFGDQVLRAMAQLLRQHAPPPMLPARIGGEEFAVLLPGADAAAAAALAERLRAAAASSRIRRKGDGDPIERVTISLGATAQRAGDDVQAIVDRADRALYASKAAGRDRVTLDA